MLELNINKILITEQAEKVSLNDPWDSQKSHKMNPERKTYHKAYKYKPSISSWHGVASSYIFSKKASLVVKEELKMVDIHKMAQERLFPR